LALWQAAHVASLLETGHPGLEVELVTVTTTGDRRPELPVWEIGGRGVFVREVQAAVLAGQADAAVHSAKDLQPVDPPGLCLGAVPERGDPRDVLVGATLSGLAAGATIATGSQRRRAQLAFLRPDLAFVGLRGNISTRLARVPPGGAVVVAMAALDRLGLAPAPMDVLDVDVMVPQVAQGALAVECRADDSATCDLVKTLDEPRSRRCVDAERSFLAAIGGACDLPVAGHATTTPDGRLQLEGLLAAPDGRAVVRHKATGPADDGARLGAEVARVVLDAGGRGLLVARGDRR
jgi:hydroxymethylbilane synthase